MDIRIEPMKAEWAGEAAQVLARAFVTNPINIAAMGVGQLQRVEAFFGVGLRIMKGPKFVALDSERIVGFVHWIESPNCQLAGFDKVKMLPAMIRALGIRSAMRTAKWLGDWEKHDPKEPHAHLGPICVDPASQGKGVGRRLMEHYCAATDAAGIAGYLETDRPENPAFYRRFGFETTREIVVLGVRNFLMWRPPRSHS